MGDAEHYAEEIKQLREENERLREENAALRRERGGFIKEFAEMAKLLGSPWDWPVVGSAEEIIETTLGRS
jgi:hypothetical protein